ncbi:permease prefix domain 1-containing protein [Xylanimonas sp. McL0601]|uniref:permease prefix domain 1-containing protein n=1 Tax=Xylanimonas sp. McL0601 TaxID=3414739 RepID=UPI003CEF254D
MDEPIRESLDERQALESQIDQWRRWVLRRRAITAADAEELEDNLRGQVADLRAGGLDDDEAFLVAVKRMGNLDDVSREFAREHSERLWKQLVLVPEEPAETSSRYRELAVLVALAVGAGIVVKALLAADDGAVLAANVAFAVLPFLAAYFAWSRRLPARTTGLLVGVAALLALAVNLYPFKDLASGRPGMTFVLAATHVPVVLWLLLGVAYTGGAWRSDARRMDFVRFTGELLIYFALVAMGGGLLLGLTAGTFNLADVDIAPFYQDWLLPFAVPGAFFVSAWLVEAKKNVVENIAPVLTRVFTPLTIVMLGAMLVVLLAHGSLISVDRNLLILMDAVLVLVLALLLYSISARDPLAPPTVFDWLQLVLVAVAFAVNAVALTAMVSRIAEFGWTANKTAALGLNVVLLAHLVWTGWLLLGFVRGTRAFGAVERWQTRYLPVYAAWAAVVVLVFPPVFAFA